jgi:hypothetical protein
LFVLKVVSQFCVPCALFHQRISKPSIGVRTPLALDLCASEPYGEIWSGYLSTDPASVKYYEEDADVAVG